MTSKRIVVFVYDHFYPDFAAGGPVTSLGTLSELLNDSSPIHVVTGAFDFVTKKKIHGIEPDRWTSWKGVQVWYASNWRSVVKAFSSFETRSRRTVYLNGIFSLRFFIRPLLMLRGQAQDIIICPRGMLQRGALEHGTLKKKIYLGVLKQSGLVKQAAWHATDHQESNDIRSHFGKATCISTILNVPRTPVDKVVTMTKEAGDLRLIYYSLLAEKKNLLFFLKLLIGQGMENIKLTIAGPVKDESYWKNCQAFIASNGLQQRVSYIGKLTPEVASETMVKFHALVLPTMGENFGHAIVEMLSLSRPVLISDQTPWNDLESCGAGITVLLDQEKWIAALRKMLSWDNKDFVAACSAASSYYRNKFDFNRLKTEYENLFKINS